MTARHETSLLIAMRLAKDDGRVFDHLMDPERLSYAIRANHILSTIEHKMAAQNKHLGELLKQVWILPA